MKSRIKHFYVKGYSFVEMWPWLMITKVFLRFTRVRIGQPISECDEIFLFSYKPTAEH